VPATVKSLSICELLALCVALYTYNNTSTQECNRKVSNKNNSLGK
jgi:hypothetical protein